MAGKGFHLTKEGIAELQEELDKLKTRRLAIAEKLKDAKDQGDLSENSDWTNAQDEHKYVENRLAEIEHVLRNAEIIETPQGGQVVQLGATVHLKHNGDTKRYVIVGSLESNPQEGKISDESPIGRAVIGKKVGDRVEIATPSGAENYLISKVA